MQKLKAGLDSAKDKVSAWRHGENKDATKETTSDPEHVHAEQQPTTALADETKYKELREAEFASITPATVEEAFATKDLPGCFQGIQSGTLRLLLLASVAAEQAYNYNLNPYGHLVESHTQAYSKLLKLTETQQLYSLIEGPNKTLFVAVPGTHDMRTAFTDVKAKRCRCTVLSAPVEKGPAVPGSGIYKVHAGFHTEAVKLNALISTDRIKQLVAAGGYQTLVVTGHSLGGALAALTSIRLLEDDEGFFKPILTCFTFGAPLIGNATLSNKIEKQGWWRHFHHVVHKSDIVPRLLTGRGLAKESLTAISNKIATAASASRERLRGLAGKAKDKAATWKLWKKKQQEEEPQQQEPHEAASVEANFADDQVEMSEEEDESNHVSKFTILKTPFSCYGRYHFLLRNVPYKSTEDPADAFTTIRKGDGLKVNAADHGLAHYCMVLDSISEKGGLAE